MDEFNVLPLLIGLVLGAAFGAGSGLAATRSARNAAVPLSPLGPDGARLPGLLFWLGFVVAVVGGLWGISSASIWTSLVFYVLIAGLAAAATATPSRRVRQRHNELVATESGWGDPD